MTTSRTALILTVMAPLLACTTTKDTPHLLQQNPSITISSQELRPRVRNQARPLAGIIERSADMIIEDSDDPELRTRALKVKTEAIPALFQALFRKDPGAALIDASAFVEQFRLDVVEDPGLPLNHGQKLIVEDAAEDMKLRLQAVFLVAGASQTEIDEFWVQIVDWAKRHPIDGNFAIRDSTSALRASWGKFSKGSLGDAISDTQAELADFAARADLYAEHLPRQARWQAQLLIEEQMANGIVAQGMEQVGTIPLSIQDLPIDIEAVLETLIEELQRDGFLVGTWIQAERDDALLYLTGERQAVMNQVSQERIAVLEALVTEREIIVEVLREERVAAFEDLEAIVSSALVSARREVIDHIFFRAAQLTAVVLPLLLIGGLILIWFARRGAGQ